MRVFGALALLFGALHLIVGVMGLAQYEHVRGTFEVMIQHAQKKEPGSYEAITSDDVTRSIRFLIGFSMAIGVASLVCGAGLLKRQLWATKGWLIVVSITAVVYSYRAASAVLVGDSNVLLLVLTSLVLILLGASWLKLSKWGRSSSGSSTRPDI